MDNSVTEQGMVKCPRKNDSSNSDTLKIVWIQGSIVHQ
jgi:hypothetical protein